MRVFLVALICFFAVPAFAYEADPHSTAYDVHAEHHGAKEAKKEVQGLPQLNPEWYLSQIFWLAVTFIVMHTVFRYKVLPDLSSVIERRREQIEGDLSAAQELKEEAERVQGEYEAMLSLAREKSSALFERVETKIKEKQQSTFDGFYKKAADQIETTERDIAEAKDKAMSEMNTVAAEVASIAAEKIVGIEADQKKTKDLIDDLERKRAA